MRIKNLILIVEKLTELSGFKVSRIDLENEKNRHFSETIKDIPQFLNTIQNIGIACNKVFLPQSLPYAEFEKFITENTIPILVFRKSQQNLKVEILFSESKNISRYYFNETNNEIYKDLFQLSDLLDYKCVCDAKREGTNIDVLKRLNENDVLFVTVNNIEEIFTPEDSKGKEIHPFTRLVSLFKFEKKEISYIYFFSILIGLINLSLPLAIQGVLNLVSGGMIYSSLVVLLFLVLVVTLLGGWMQIMQVTMVEILQQRIFTKSALELTFKIPKVKMEALNKIYYPEMVNRFFDVLTIKKSLPKVLIDLTAAAIQIIFGIILLAFYHPIFIGFGAFLIFIVFLIFYFTNEKALQTSLKESKYKYQIVSWLEEIARNIKTFKLAGITDLPSEKTDKLLTKYLKFRNEHFKTLKKQYWAVVIFKTFITVSLLVIGAILVINKQINLGQFVAAEIIIVLVITSVEKLISTIDSVYDLLTGLDKLSHLTEIPLENTSGLLLHEFGKDTPINIKLENLSYSYKGSRNQALKDISFNIKSGEKIIIAGEANSGKSTLMKILSALFFDYTGNFTINDLSLREIDIRSYRDFIGEYFGDNEIFDGSIEENITVGKRDISLAKLISTCHALGLHDFIVSSPNGFSSPVESDGKFLPASIRQKLILARAIAEDPRILLIEDLEFIDYQNKEKISNLIFGKNNSSTVIISSNDEYLIKQSERVIELKDGKVIFDGKSTDYLSKKVF